MSKEFIFKGHARCIWCEPNNGIMKAIFEPEPNHKDIEYMQINLHKSHGIPQLDKLYWFDIQPAFPHDTERKEN